jgi:hypothetical protein
VLQFRICRSSLAIPLAQETDGLGGLILGLLHDLGCRLSFLHKLAPRGSEHLARLDQFTLQRLL